MTAAPHPSAGALAAALGDDPFYAALGADLPAGSPHRQIRLTAYFAYALGEAAAAGRVVAADPAQLGAAIWLLPEAEPARQAREAAKSAALRGILGAVGFANYARMIAAMEAQTRAAIPHGSWYLSILGVAPGVQGRGHGAALLRPTLAEADRHGARCYLETFGERSLGFYQRLGFHPQVIGREELTGARYWVLIR